MNFTVVPEGNYISDKTFNEIKTAIESGLICQAKVEVYVIPLTQYSNKALCFSCVTSPAGTPNFMQITINNDDTIHVIGEGLQTIQ